MDIKSIRDEFEILKKLVGVLRTAEYAIDFIVERAPSSIQEQQLIDMVAASKYHAIAIEHITESLDLKLAQF